jgi:AraC-like DNA-binding protein
LEQARYLLLDKSVKEVAAELGYSDPFTFSAQFKGHFGLSPQRFQGW